MTFSRIIQRVSVRPAKRLICLLVVTALTACAPRASMPVEGPDPSPSPAAPLVAATLPAALLDDADPASLRQAVERSLAWLERVPPDSAFDYGIRSVSAGELSRALGELSAFLGTHPDAAALSEWVLARFEVVESVGEPAGEVLVTGYYEPVIAGSPEPTATARVPVYARPADLVTARLREFRDDLPDERITGRVQGASFRQYYSRREIQEEGALEGRGLEIAWVEDRVDLFFVEVQGSGAIRYPDGSELRIGYAASNGHPYRSIGRVLIEEGKIPRERMSMQAIRSYLAAHPDEVSRVLNQNPSYVFFRTLDTPPLGSLGVPVTGGRSIATDYRLFPPAGLAFLDTTRPALDAEGNVIAGAPLRRFVLNQDTGGAIRGAGRVDFFWGRGEDAAAAAGLMQQAGRLFFLVPRR